MQRQGKGTGSVRQARFDAQFGHLPQCQHKCSCGKVWKHRSVGQCHFGVFVECGQCSQFDLNGEPFIIWPEG